MKIIRTYARKYRDNGQHILYVEWIDHKGRTGRTEGRMDAEAPHFGEHMRALLNAADAQGIKLEHEVW